MTLAIDPDTNDCPLCMEELDVLEKHFKPCTCGYQICRFCWHHIKSNLNGRCPGCRRLYSEQHIRFVPISEELIKEIEKDEGVKVRMAGEPSKQQLSALRVIQRNVVHVINMSLKHADNEMLRKFGKIEKLVITKPPSIGAGFYLTFAKEADANRAREELNGMKLEGETIRTFFGTTKYCTHFINKTKCPIKECLFLHELVADKPKTAPTG
ncbi:RING/Ubox like zinc-binding domain-containing protein [Sporodiniella umbellata]|nr:RING/Ubox like zinc-binding domain-containing protein [Sporodiniella umbellata]